MGKMVVGGDNWQEQWHGLMPMSKVAVVQLSQGHFQSKFCVNELRAICKEFDSDHILPVIVRVDPPTRVVIVVYFILPHPPAHLPTPRPVYVGNRP